MNPLPLGDGTRSWLLRHFVEWLCDRAAEVVPASACPRPIRDDLLAHGWMQSAGHDAVALTQAGTARFLEARLRLPSLLKTHWTQDDVNAHFAAVMLLVLVFPDDASSALASPPADEKSETLVPKRAPHSASDRLVLDVENGLLRLDDELVDLGASHKSYLAQLQRLAEARRRDPEGGYVKLKRGELRHLRDFLNERREGLAARLLKTGVQLGVRLVAVPTLGNLSGA